MITIYGCSTKQRQYALSCNVQFAPNTALARLNIELAASYRNGRNGSRKVHHNGWSHPAGATPASCT